MKTLLLITSHFPFGKGESFIEAEIKRLAENFDRIIIISQDVSGELTVSIPAKVKVFRYNTTTSIMGFIILPVLIIINCVIISRLLIEELLFRRNISYRLSVKQLGFLVKKIIKAIQLKNYIEKILRKENVQGKTLIYSYWLNTGAHAAGLLKHKNLIKIARAHRNDLYEEKTRLKFLPLLRFSAKSLDNIFFISEDGEKYFTNKTRIKGDRFTVSRLGVENPVTVKHFPFESEKFTIVSCSNLVPVKRIEMIILALEILQIEKYVYWYHFGDGEMKDELEKLAEQKLGDNKKIGYHFMGHVPNNKLKEFYSDNKIDLFINTSSSEGIPVSIMEAQSFGIPVIATDTGGVKEVVTESTGILLPENFFPADLAAGISYFANLNEKDVNKIKLKAYENWMFNFNAATNYGDFITRINSTLAP